jgi:hypothetical protein
MKALRRFEMLPTTRPTTERHIPEGFSLQSSQNATCGTTVMFCTVTWGAEEALRKAQDIALAIT